MRKVFIDLGANTGEVSARVATNNPTFEIFCVEPNSKLLPSVLEKGIAIKRHFNIMWAAAWTYDGAVDLFESGADLASTVVRGKVEFHGWPQIDYSKANPVPCFDFSRWLLKNFTLEDNIVVKMDIEGAEYAVLQKMISDRSMYLVRRLICEWHQNRYPDISSKQHNAVRDQVARMTQLQDWI